MMDYRPTTHYISRSMTSTDPYGTGPTLVDGLEVVDEQVVALSPLDVEAPRRRRSAVGRGSRREADHALG
jgi:hypothetical protein